MLVFLPSLQLFLFLGSNLELLLLTILCLELVLFFLSSLEFLLFFLASYVNHFMPWAYPKFDFKFGTYPISPIKTGASVSYCTSGASLVFPLKCGASPVSCFKSLAFVVPPFNRKSSYVYSLKSSFFCFSLKLWRFSCLFFKSGAFLDFRFEFGASPNIPIKSGASIDLIFKLKASHMSSLKSWISLVHLPCAELSLFQVWYFFC